MALPAVGMTATQKTTGAGEALADKALVDRVRGGDERAFELLVRAHQERIYYAVLRLVRNHADAQDVTQKAFVRAHQKLDSFRGDSAFRTWLYRIAVNLAKNHIRDNFRERPSEIAETDLAASATGLKRVILDEEKMRLRDAVESLPEKQRLIVELRIYDEMPFKVIAEVAECTVNSAKVNFHHGMKKLRELLSETTS
jgi:RNA polymerase sigma-70 factor (ECF subfamily)